MSPDKNILMNESFKTLLEIFIPVVSSLATAVIAWVMRGKYESKKVQLEIDNLALDLRKEEIQFRKELMLEVTKLQEQVVELQKVTHTQALQIQVLTERLSEKDKIIEGLESDKAFHRETLVQKNELIEKLIKNEKSS